MFKKTLIALFLLVSMSGSYVVANHNPTSTIELAGGVNCQSYQCQQAQQEIQYLYDAIYFEKQKQYPNWPAIKQAEARIRWLQQIR